MEIIKAPPPAQVEQKRVAKRPEILLAILVYAEIAHPARHRFHAQNAGVQRVVLVFAQPGLGGDPQDPRRPRVQARHPVVGQAVFEGQRLEIALAPAAEARLSAKPHDAVGLAENRGHMIVRQPLAGGKGVLPPGMQSQHPVTVRADPQVTLVVLA